MVLTELNGGAVATRSDGLEVSVGIAHRTAVPCDGVGGVAVGSTGKVGEGLEGRDLDRREGCDGLPRLEVCVVVGICRRCSENAGGEEERRNKERCAQHRSGWFGWCRVRLG